MSKVPYGSPVNYRKNNMKTKMIIAMWALLFPTQIVSWLLFPLWFAPLHELGWGSIENGDMAFGAGFTHGMLLFCYFVVTVTITVIRAEDGRWIWEPKHDK